MRPIFPGVFVEQVSLPVNNLRIYVTQRTGRMDWYNKAHSAWSFSSFFKSSETASPVFSSVIILVTGDFIAVVISEKFSILWNDAVFDAAAHNK